MSWRLPQNPKAAIKVFRILAGIEFVFVKILKRNDEVETTLLPFLDDEPTSMTIKSLMHKIIIRRTVVGTTMVFHKFRTFRLFDRLMSSNVI